MKTLASQTGAACVPSGLLSTASVRLMTADRSPCSSFLGKASHLRFEHLAAFCVIRKHVEAGTRRCQQYRSSRPRQGKRPTNSVGHSVGVVDGHKTAEHLAESRPGFANSDDGIRPHTQRRHQVLEVTAFEATSHDDDEITVEALHGRAR